MIQTDLTRDWAQPEEKIRIALGSRARAVASRIGGEVQVPHPVPLNAPEVVVTDQPHPTPYSGALTGHDWTDDDSIGWWAEAQNPGQDAVLAADALAIGRGETGLAITDRRLAVLLPEHMLVSFRTAQKAARKEKGLFGQAMSTVGNWAFGHDHWDFGDKVISLWETDVRRVRGWSRAMVGRSFPFADVLRIDLTDGSALYVRTNQNDFIDA